MKISPASDIAVVYAASVQPSVDRNLVLVRTTLSAARVV